MSKKLAKTIVVAAMLALWLISMVQVASAQQIVELDTWNEATAELTTDAAYSGSWSVFLSVSFDGMKDAWFYQFDKYGEEGAIISVLPVTPMLLSDFNFGDFSCKFKQTAGIESPRYVIVLDTEPDGTEDKWLVSQSIDYVTDSLAGSPPTDWVDLASELSRVHAAGLATWNTTSYALPSTYAGEAHGIEKIKLAYPSAVITRFEIRLDGVDKDPVAGAYVEGTPVTCSAYVDDITFNGITYDLEPPPPPAEIVLSPVKGFSTTIVGEHFAPDSIISILWGATQLPTVPSEVITDGEGSFTCIITAPEQLIQGGSLTITAEDVAGNTASAPFIVPETKGDPGLRGPEGPRGSTGSKGEKGSKGDPGEQGSPGPAGKTGPQGPAGEKGDKGDPGVKGDTGPSGPAGPKGDKGDKGDPGEPAPTAPVYGSVGASIGAIIIAIAAAIIKRK